MHFYFAVGNYLITIVRLPETLWRSSETVSVLCVLYWIVDCGLIWINPLYWQFIVLVTKHEKYTYGDRVLFLNMSGKHLISQGWNLNKYGKNKINLTFRI
jgi:hypothetical protein